MDKKINKRNSVVSQTYIGNGIKKMSVYFVLSILKNYNYSALRCTGTNCEE